MKYHFIAIEREYGSGGSEIAKRLAEKCGIACYGREILEALAQKSNIPISQIEKYEESATNSLLYSLFLMSSVQSGNSSGHNANEERVYTAEQAIIKELAAKGDAVFIGHCASEALAGRSGVARVFIRSNYEQKKDRIVKEYGVSPSLAESEMKRYNKKRGNYYYANTAKKWNDPDNYDIVLDSGSLGIEGCVKALSGLLQ